MNERSSYSLRWAPLSAILCLVLLSVGLAQKINWGNSVGDTNINSLGDGLDATYTFELGSFVQSAGDALVDFVPTEANRDEWASHWVPHDTAVYNQASPPFDKTGFFSDSWTVEDNTYEGLQAYIWVYNNQNGDETSQWVLITDLEGDDAWRIPSSSGSTQVFPEAWRVSTATDVLYGGLNGVNGPGVVDPDSPSDFALQTHGIPVTPEPGSVVVLGLTLTISLLGRRRSRGQ